MTTVTIIGVGRVGGALAQALPSEKYRIEDLIVREVGSKLQTDLANKVSARLSSLGKIGKIASEIIFITTQDGEIADVTAKLDATVGAGTFVFHTSGSLSSEILDPLSARGCLVGSMHPLVSISTMTPGTKVFEGAYFCIEGQDAASEKGESVVADLGGRPFTIPTRNKALYHAAAVMACGHLVALFDISAELVSKCGVNRSFSNEILIPLVESTVRNLAEQGPAAALTGTFARTDFETLDRHIAALLQNASPETLDLYLLLGSRSLDLALERGADPEAVAVMRKRISMAKREAK